jgi:hypothetical protein
MCVLGIPVITIHIAGTALPKTHYFPIAIERALSFKNVKMVRVTSYSGLDLVTYRTDKFDYQNKNKIMVNQKIL